MRLKLSASLEQLIEYCWMAAAVALPLVCAPVGADVFELPKSLIMITLAALLLVATLLHLAVAPRGSISADPPLMWILLWYSLAAVGATVLSTGLQDSLFGSFLRDQGLLTILGYQILLLSAAMYVRTLEQALRLLRILVWTSAPVCLFGLLQYLGFNPLDWKTDSSSPLMSTVGRSNFFGAYLVLLLPLTMMLLAETNRRRPLVLLLAVLQLACLVLSHARSSWVGLGAALVTWLLLRRSRSSTRRSLPRFFPPLLAAGTAWVLTGFLAEPFGLAAPAGFTPVVESLMAQGGSVAARLTIWQRGVDLFLERPWLGYGFDTLEPVFTRSFPPELVYYQGRNVMVDRAHNIWLDIGLNSGFLGLSAMAALFVLVGHRIYRALTVSGDPRQRLICLGLAAALAGHLADLQFSFDVIATGAVFWLLLGISVALSPNLPSALPDRSRSRTSRPGLAALWLFFFAFFFSLWPLHVLQADRLYAKASQEERPLTERIENLEQAVRLQPRRVEYHLALAGLYGIDGDPAAAEKHLQAAWRLRPNDPWIMLMRGHLYARFQNVSQEYLDKAESAYRQTVKLAPDISSFHTVLAMTLINQGRLFTALDELDEALRLDETDPVVYEQLAGLYALLGNTFRAEEARRQAEHWLEHEREKAGP